MKSTLRNMILSLTVLTIVIGGILAGVSLLTAEPIREASLKARLEAMSAVLPEFDNDIFGTAVTTDDGLTVYTASLGGEPVGTAVETFSDDGFSGRITIIAGFGQDGAVTGYRVLEHAETPGLGARMSEWFAAEGTSHNVLGTTDVLRVSNDGGDTDAITGATITSRAFLDALNKARKAAAEHKNINR